MLEEQSFPVRPSGPREQVEVGFPPPLIQQKASFWDFLICVRRRDSVEEWFRLSWQSQATFNQSANLPFFPAPKRSNLPDLCDANMMLPIVSFNVGSLFLKLGSWNPKTCVPHCSSQKKTWVYFPVWLGQRPQEYIEQSSFFPELYVFFQRTIFQQ